MENLATWLVKDKVVLTSIIGALRTADLPKLDAEVLSLFESSSTSNIHVLADISMMTSMPGIFQMSKLEYIKHPKIGFFVTQSRNSAEQFIGKTVGQLLKTKYKFVTSIEDGVHFLAQIDDTLPSEDEMIQKLQIIRSEFMAINSLEEA